MAFCPNEACPFRVRQGRAAEYRSGFERCSDCGATLDQGAPPAVPVENKRGAAQPFPWRALAVTGLGPLALWVSHSVPLPGIDAGTLESLQALDPRSGLLARLSIGALGLMPFVTAFVVVESMAALVPRWRALRTSGPEGRVKLGRAVAALGCLIALFQAWSQTQWLLSLGRVGYDSSPVLVEDASPFNALLITLTLVGGSAALLILASLITRRGLGNGWAVLLLSGFVFEAASVIPARIALVRAEVTAPASLPLFFVVHGGAALATVALLRLRRDGPLRNPLGGISAATLAPVAVGTALGWLALLSGQTLLRGEGVPSLFSAVLVVPLSVGFALLWNQPRAVAQAVSRAGADSAKAGSAVRAELPRAIGLAGLFGGALVLAPLLISAPGFASLALLSTVTATAIVVDLGAELGALRQRRDWVAVWPLHQVYAVAPVRTLLREAHIDCHLRGENFRVLFPFFEAYVPVEVFVPEADAPRARELLEHFALGEPAAAASPARVAA
ncbi:MAG: hypothetical protein AB1938_12905 [Myxococcota bacterium]